MASRRGTEKKKEYACQDGRQRPVLTTWATQEKPKLHARNLMGWGEDRPSWAWAPAARCTTTVLLERPFEETSRSASGARTSSELGGCTPCGAAPQTARCRTVQISKAKLDTASAACEGGLVAHDRSGVFYWGSRVSAVWELVRAEPTSLTLATKPHRGGAVTGGFTNDWRETGP